MNILLVGKRSIQESVGVEQKLNSQIAAFEALGHRVWYTHAGPDGCFLHGPAGTVKLLDYKNVLPAGRAQQWNAARLLLAVAQTSSVIFDLCYIRKPLCDSLHLKALAALRARGTVLVEEIPTYPYDAELRQQKNFSSRIFLMIDKLHRKKLKRYLHYIATYSTDEYIFGVPTISVENAVSVESIPPSLPPQPSEPFSFVAVSSMYFWHGYDRFIRGLGEYRRKNGAHSVTLHLVGDGPELANWQALAQAEGVGDAVVFHGGQSGPALEAIFGRSHLAVSSLGWYRKGMGETPTFELKTRDYIARGKPFLYACQDPRARAVAPYSLQLPNDDSPIDIEHAIAFFERINEQGYSQFLRNYALNHLRWEPQMQKIVDAARPLLKTHAENE